MVTPPNPAKPARLLPRRWRCCCVRGSGGFTPSSDSVSGALPPASPPTPMVSARTPALQPSLRTPACHHFRLLQVTCIMDDDASQVGEGRVRPRTGMNQGVAMDIDEMEPRNMENDLVAADGLGELMELKPAMLAVRATKMFTEGDGAPRVSAPGRSRMRAPPSARPEPSPSLTSPSASPPLPRPRPAAPPCGLQVPIIASDLARQGHRS